MIFPLYAICVFSQALKGRILFKQYPNYVKIDGTIAGLLPQGLHGFHVHQNGNLSDNCAGAGPHFNPFNKTHGGQLSTNRHVGDLGNIFSDSNGNSIVSKSDRLISLSRPLGIYGRALVVHEKADDNGEGGNLESLKTGNAGRRLDCCIIKPYLPPIAPYDNAYG